MRRALFPLMLAAGLAIPPVARAESKPTPQLAPPNAPKSEFTFRPGFTRDPFFPKTQVTPTNSQVVVVAAGTIPDWLMLKGVALSGGRKLAIINDQSVGENETFRVKRAGGVFNFRCLEIHTKSVIVGAGEATKELFLREP